MALSGSKEVRPICLFDLVAPFRDQYWETFRIQVYQLLDSSFSDALIQFDPAKYDPDVC